MGDWRSWIPANPDWATDQSSAALGSLQSRWTTSADGWQGMAIAAVLACFFIVALGYMFGYAFNHAGIKRWAKSEYYQALANGLMVVGLLFFVAIATDAMSAVTADIAQASGGLQYMQWDPVAEQYVPDDSLGYVNNPFVLAQLFLDENIQCLRTWYLNLFIADTIVEPISDFSVGIAGMDALSLSTPLGGLVSFFYFASHNVVFLLIANYFQRHLLIFIFQTMFTVFLPIGIILRILPVTRGYGGFLIALALGLYIVYPITYSTMMLTTKQMNAEECRLTIDAAEVSGIQITDEQSFFYHKAKSDRLLDLMTPMRDKFNSWFVFMVYRSFLFPLVALTIVFTFIRASAAFFGADIAELGRGLVKLI